MSNTSKNSALSVAVVWVVWVVMLLSTFTEYLALVTVSKLHPTLFTKYLTVLSVHTCSVHFSSKLIVTVTWHHLLAPPLDVGVLADFIL